MDLLTDNNEIRNWYTSGSWATEAQSVSAFSTIIERTNQFHVYPEVTGYYLQPKLEQQTSKPRIDLILVPRNSLIDQGWRYGPIGIECKRSGEKIGRAISQMLDYSRAAWQIEPAKGLWVMLQWVFLWPLDKTSGPVASIMAQHRLGCAEPGNSRWAPPRLVSGTTFATFHIDGRVEIGPGANSGRKAGSR